MVLYTNRKQTDARYIFNNFVNNDKLKGNHISANKVYFIYLEISIDFN